MKNICDSINCLHIQFVMHGSHDRGFAAINDL